MKINVVDLRMRKWVARIELTNLLVYSFLFLHLKVTTQPHKVTIKVFLHFTIAREKNVNSNLRNCFPFRHLHYWWPTVTTQRQIVTFHLWLLFKHDIFLCVEDEWLFCKVRLYFVTPLHHKCMNENALIKPFISQP